MEIAWDTSRVSMSDKGGDECVKCSMSDKGGDECVKCNTESATGLRLPHKNYPIPIPSSLYPRSQVHGYPSLHDALANNNVHDSNRLQNHTPRNPFRHLKQQRKHHSIRASHQATPHAQKQTTQRTTQQTRKPHSRHVPDGFCRENHVVKRFHVTHPPASVT